MQPVATVAIEARTLASPSCLACRRSSAARRNLVLVAGSRNRRSDRTRLQSAYSYHTEADRSQDNDDGSTGNQPSGPQSSVAAHILAQARVEEADLSPSASLSSRLLESQRKEIPWQGDESVRNGLLRQLCLRKQQEKEKLILIWNHLAAENARLNVRTGRHSLR